MTNDTCGQLLLPLSPMSNHQFASLKMCADIYSLDLNKSQQTYKRMGYCVKAGLFSAAECGATHNRERLFILAYRNDDGRTGRRNNNDERSILSNEKRQSATAHQDGMVAQFGGWQEQPACATVLVSAVNGANSAEVANGNVKKRLTNEVVLWQHFHQHHLIQTDGKISATTLNPQFCEWLMGWPIGWTELEPVGTELSHWLQRMHGELSRLILN